MPLQIFLNIYMQLPVVKYYEHFYNLYNYNLKFPRKSLLASKLLQVKIRSYLITILLNVISFIILF
jgi:hypothetical protein